MEALGPVTKWAVGKTPKFAAQTTRTASAGVVSSHHHQAEYWTGTQPGEATFYAARPIIRLHDSGGAHFECTS